MAERRRRGGVIIGLAVLALLAGGALWWSRTRAPRPAAPPAAEPRDPGAILKARQAARAGGSDRTPAAASGTVRDAATGAPIAGALVLVSPASFLGVRDDATGAEPAPLHARSDAAGAFALARVPPGRYRVSASAPGYLPGQLLDVLVKAGQPRGDLELRLAAGGRSLSGTVSDVGGGPIAGALVSARRLSGGSLIGGGDAPAATLADERGVYRLDLAEGVYDVTASHADYVAGAANLSLRGAAAVLDFVLTPGASVQGVVLAASDRHPVAGAIVKASGGRASMEGLGSLGDLAAIIGAGGVVTDAAGRFSLRGLGSGSVELSARAAGLASRESTTVQLGIGEELTGVEILVDASRSVSGYVVRAGHEAEGVPGVLVGGVQMKGGVTPTDFDETDETGYFELLGLARGKYALVAAKDGLLPNLMRTIVEVGDEDVKDVLIVVDAGATLRGRVEPAAAAHLTLQVDTAELGIMSMLGAVGAVLVHGSAGPDGRFELRGVPQGAYGLVARADDGRKGLLPVLVRLDDQDGLVVKLETRGSIAGRVVDTRGAAVAGVDVHTWKDGGDRLLDLGELTAGEVRSGEDGGFEVLGLEPGTYRFAVSDETGGLELVTRDGQPEPTVEIAASERKQGVVLTVEPRGGSIRGRVIGEDGAPVADAWVSVRQGWAAGARGDDAKAEADDDAPEDGGRAAARPALTDADGRFTLTRLREDEVYDLSAEAAGARGHKRRVAPGADVVIRLRPLAGLAGRVTAGGQPVGDYRIAIDGPGEQDKHVLAADGRYAFARLDPGKYRVRVSSEEGALESSATVASGKTTTLDLALEPWGEIRGQIVDAVTGKPLAGLNVVADSEALGDGGEQAMGMLTGGGPKTDADGRFRIGKLGAGNGTLRAFSGLLSGFRPVVSHGFELRPGEKKDLGTIEGLGGERVPEREQGELGFDAGPGVDAKLVVFDVAAGGAAAAAGLAAKDQLEAIDGRPVAELGVALAATMLSRERVRAGQVVRLTVVRDGKPLAAEIVVTAR